MNESASTNAEFPLRGKKLPHPFLSIGNELFDLYVPIMGADCFAVYAYFARRWHSDPSLRHDVRSIAQSCDMSASTVSRALEVLEHLQMVKLTRFGGSRDSECQLSDSWTVATRLGATYDSNSQSYCFPAQVSERLKAEVCAIRERQRGEAPVKTKATSVPCGNLRLGVSRGNTSVSPVKGQRCTGKTQMGTHLIRKEERTKDSPLPTSTPNGNGGANRAKDSPDEDEPDGLLKRSKAKFIAAINELEDYLFDTRRPSISRLKNGAQEAKDFGFASLAVETAQWSGETLVLTLSARDPAAASKGLKKYHRTCEPSLRKWYGCKVEWEIQEASRNWWTAERE